MSLNATPGRTRHKGERAMEKPEIVQVGDRVRSHDFPRLLRDPETGLPTGLGACYVEGVVEEVGLFQGFHHDCTRVKIRVERRIWDGRESALPGGGHDGYVYPPQNGIPTYGGHTFGIEKLPA